MSRLFIAVLVSALLFACSNEGSSNSGSTDTNGVGAAEGGDTGATSAGSVSEEIDARNEEILQEIDTNNTTSVDGGVSDIDTSSDSGIDSNSNSDSNSSSLDDTNDINPGTDNTGIDANAN